MCNDVFQVEEIFDIFDEDGNEQQGDAPYPFMVSQCLLSLNHDKSMYVVNKS
jgi:hypothetical protein